jgi:RNA polymerase sigma-70 factor (ECF subfamily)
VSASAQDPPPPGGAPQWIDAAHNSGEALGRLLERFRSYLLLVANGELPADVRPKVGASDLVQETLLRAHNHFDRFRGRTEDELRAWLRRILLNYMANVTQHYRGTAKRDLAREVPLPLVAADELEDALAAETESPSTEALARERTAALHRALEQLPPRYRQVISWRNYDRLSFGEIGQRLDSSAEAARKLWARAIDRLGQALEPPDEARG